jgi:hypothetical protein
LDGLPVALKPILVEGYTLIRKPFNPLFGGFESFIRNLRVTIDFVVGRESGFREI